MEYKQLNLLINSLDNIKALATKMFNMTDSIEYNKAYMSLALQLEKLTNDTRTATVIDTCIDRKEYISKVTSELNITVRSHRKKIIITLPYLLPKRHSVLAENYIIEPLTNALQQYVRANNPKKIRQPLIAIKSIYSEDNKKAIRDNDNIEIRHVINAISTMLFVDDNDMDIFLCSRISNQTYTEITVFDRRKKYIFGHKPYNFSI